MGEYRVRAGDCMSSIAYRHGFRPETLWELPENAQLRERRSTMFQLIPGEDVVFVPEPRRVERAVAIDRRHRFRRRSVPERLVLRFEDERGEPRVGLGYSLELDGAIAEGETDDEGQVIEWIRPDAQLATLTLFPNEVDAEHETHELLLGTLAPVDRDEGRHQRLYLLGFIASAQPDLDDPGASLAIERGLLRFQREFGLELSGVFDAPTIAALDERFGGEA